MRAAAAVLGKEVLHGTSIEDLLNNADEIREKAGDRAFLRAIHFVTENVRVQNAVAALRAEAIPTQSTTKPPSLSLNTRLTRAIACIRF